MKLKGLSLFSNVGIAELLLCKLDAEILLANELIANRAKFYKKIYPKTLMICGDITKSKIKNELIKESINKKINFIMATPPCQGMSTAGKKNNHNDPRNLLITHTIDIIKKIEPNRSHFNFEACVFRGYWFVRWYYYPFFPFVFPLV